MKNVGKSLARLGWIRPGRDAGGSADGGSTPGNRASVRLTARLRLPVAIPGLAGRTKKKRSRRKRSPGIFRIQWMKMDQEYKLLIINPGSTSTKISLFVNDNHCMG